MSNDKSTFNLLNSVDVNDKKRANQGNAYLPWATAWGELKKRYPDASYEFVDNQHSGLPYFESVLGLMVRTKVTVNGETLSMTLPVMNTANKAMKSEAYTYIVKSGERRVEAATMFDVNTAQMRCLAKNIAMFGLGLYIYLKEAMPDVELIDSNQIKQISALCQSKKVDLMDLMKVFGIGRLSELYAANFESALLWINKKR